MNTITIDQNIYDGAAKYARKHNISMKETVEEGLKLLIAKVNIPHNNDDDDLKAALAYIDTIPAKGGKSIPDNENGMDILVNKKYKL